MAAHLRNETEGTGSIATFRDLDESIVTRSRQDARRRFVVEIGSALIAERNERQRARVCLRIADCEDIVDLAGADESINFRQLRFQLIAITLDQTTRHDQPFGLAFTLEARR